MLQLQPQEDADSSGAPRRRRFPTARIVHQIHDELILECRADCVDGVSGLLRSCMEGVAGKLGLSVALPVAVRVGRNWDELEK